MQALAQLANQAATAFVGAWARGGFATLDRANRLLPTVATPTVRAGALLHNLCVPLVTRVLTVRSFYSLTGRALWLTLRLPTVATANRLTFTPFGRPWCCRARPAHQFPGENQRLSCEPGVGFGARRKQPCACTPNFAGFARLGSALGPGESPRERQPFGRVLRNPPKWAAAISSGCLRIRFQSSCRFPYSYRVTTSFELPYTDSRNPPYLRMY